MAEEADLAAQGPRIGGWVEAEHAGFPCRQGQKAGDNPEQARLAGPVGTLEGEDLPRAHVKIGAGQERVTSGERNGGT